MRRRGTASVTLVALMVACLVALSLAPPARAGDALPTLRLAPGGAVDLVAGALTVRGDPSGAGDLAYPEAVRRAWRAAQPAAVRPLYSSRWLVARLESPAGQANDRWVLRMSTDPLYLPEVVVLDDAGRVERHERRPDAVAIGPDSGAALAAGQRFQLHIPPGESRVVALRVSAISYGSLAADVLATDRYVAWAARQQAIVMTALGLLAAVAGYNLLLGIGLRAPTYAWYALHAASHLAYWSTLYGLTADLAGFTDHDRLVYKVSSTVTFLAAPFFVRGLLGVKAWAPRLDRMLWLCGWVGVALLLPCLFLAPWPEMHRAWIRGAEYQFLLALVETPLFLLAGALALRHRVAGACWFLLGWGVYLVAVLALVAATYGLWRFSGEWLVVGLLGATWEVMMLSQALAARIKALDTARLASEAELASQEALLAAVSHELRTPLNAILGMARMLGREALPTRAAWRVASIGKAGETLLGMVSNLLDRASLDAGRLHLLRGPTRLSEVMDDLAVLMGDLAAAKGLLLHADVGYGVPPWVTLDAARVKQVLVGLIGNAVKYTDAGHVVAHVHGEDGRLWFTVSDTGKGIAPAERERIFDRFQRGSGEGAPGTGLGLAIARDLVEAMGGRLTVDDAPQGGARFSFDLPLEPAHAPAAAAARRLTVLVVDDLEINREVAAALLRGEGHDPVTAAPEAALDILLGRPVDAVLLDVNMPGLDGVELARRIRALPDPATAGMTLIALSAGVQPDDRRRLESVGVGFILPKPLTVEGLRAALDGAASRSYKTYNMTDA